MAQHDDKQAERLNRELTKYEKLDEAEINQVIESLIADPKGGKFLWWLLQAGKYGINPFSPDPTTMAFQAGEMNVGNAILARIVEVNPMGFAQLQMNRKLESDRRYSSAQRLANGNDLFVSADDSDAYDPYAGLTG